MEVTASMKVSLQKQFQAPQHFSEGVSTAVREQLGRVEQNNVFIAKNCFEDKGLKGQMSSNRFKYF